MVDVAVEPDEYTHVGAEADYWDVVGAVVTVQRPQTLWRAHSDAVNCAWLAPRLSTRHERLLKTDLFDEALAVGLYPLLSERSRQVVGIDVSVATAQAARQRYAHLRQACGDVRTLPFPAATFDAVVSNSTLDHFGAEHDIATGLQELWRVLRPGGQLLLTLDNLANPVVALRNALPFRPLNALNIVPYQVGVTCGPDRLLQLVHAAGFDVHDVGAILHCPRVLAVAVAALLQRYGSSQAQHRLLGCLMAFERLARWRTRFRTGYFITVVATKR